MEFPELPKGPRVGSTWTYAPTTEKVVLEDGWAEVHCFVRVEQAAGVAAAVRGAVPLSTRVELRGARRDPRTGGFTADRSPWRPVR